MNEAIDLVYQFMERLGYTHPIHPPLTHAPMGLVIGVFVFALVAILFRRSILPQLAYNRMILLALIFCLPTILFGYMDWNYFYEGAWSSLIKIKLILSAALLLLLGIALISGRKSKPETKSTLMLYTLCFLAVGILGYSGGQLMIEREGKPHAATVRFLSGEKLFATHCNDCHPGAGDILNAPPLSGYNTFLAFLRHPQGTMPAFPPDMLSDSQVKKVYRYIARVREKQKAR
jgi:uncharacterized membrane protein